MATATAEKAPHKVEEHKPQNPVHALVKRSNGKPPAKDSWQDGFMKIADSLDATGNQWLGHIFREVADPPVVDEPAVEPVHASKSGK